MSGLNSKESESSIKLSNDVSDEKGGLDNLNFTGSALKGFGGK